jgi:glycine dehydrogenase subunit 1
MRADKALDALMQRGVMAGVPYHRLSGAPGLENVLLVCATETNTDEDIGAYAAALEEVLS